MDIKTKFIAVCLKAWMSKIPCHLLIDGGAEILVYASFEFNERVSEFTCELVNPLCKAVTIVAQSPVVDFSEVLGHVVVNLPETVAGLENSRLYIKNTDDENDLRKLEQIDYQTLIAQEIVEDSERLQRQSTFYKDSNLIQLLPLVASYVPRVSAFSIFTLEDKILVKQDSAYGSETDGGIALSNERGFDILLYPLYNRVPYWFSLEGYQLSRFQMEDVKDEHIARKILACVSLLKPPTKEESPDVIPIHLDLIAQPFYPEKIKRAITNAIPYSKTRAQYNRSGEGENYYSYDLNFLITVPRVPSLTAIMLDYIGRRQQPGLFEISRKRTGRKRTLSEFNDDLLTS